VRQPEHPAHPLLFIALAPAPTRELQFWHSGKGEYALSRPALGPASLHSTGETEAIFYSEAPRNCFRMELPLSGMADIAIAPAHTLPLPAALREALPQQQPLWRATWTCPPAAISQCSLAWGITAALRDFHGRLAMRITDASLDFGPFYAQVALGALPLNLHTNQSGQLALRKSALPVHHELDPRPAHTLALAAEFLHMVAPDAIATLLDTILFPPEPGDTSATTPTEDPVARLLLAARAEELYRALSTRPISLKAMYNLLETLLDQCAPPDAIPLAQDSTHEPLYHAGFTARCYRALQRWADIARDNEQFRIARRCADTAQNLFDAARRPVEEGGLWHTRHSVFVSRAPDQHDPDDATYDHRSHLEALHFGLCNELREVQRGFDWLDDAFSYTSGRAAPNFPPNATDTCTLLLDACLRHRWGLASATTLLQYLASHALDTGLPFPAQLPVRPNLETKDFPALMTQPSCGSLLAAAPWFGLVLQQHYGLEYTAAGWRIGQPNPIPGYPLTRLTNLAHERATFAISWQGRGRLRRISVNGLPHDAPFLNATEDRHEVVVYLG
jgi:hypothetical protein